MKKIIFTIAFIFTVIIVNGQTAINIVRTQAITTTATIKGIVLNGQELGNIRYVYDGTAAIPAFGVSVATVNRGDTVTVSGTLKNFNCLLELDPVSSIVVNNSSNPLPSPIVLNPNQYNETNEAQLIQFNSVTFKKTGNFAGNNNYVIVGSTPLDTAVVRVVNGSSIIGTPIPTGVVNLIGVGSQFSSNTSCVSGYQVLLRDLNDIIPTASVFLTQDLVQTNIAQSSMDVQWSTNVAGTSSFIKIGTTSGNYTQTINLISNTSIHTETISGLTPATVYYLKAYTINGTDTAKTIERIFATQSTSSGEIKVYFNRSTDSTVALAGNFANSILNTIDDTLVAYIDRAQNTLDISIYNWDASSGITTAINNAYTRGVQIRIILDGSTAQIGAQTLNPLIKLGVSPQTSAYTIMHNKVIIADAESAANAYVLTGSTNWTNNQLNTDANNLITIQDQSLARAYKLEFDEMWGDSVYASTFNPILAKFGQFKTDNVPHTFNINGKQLELFFSPSDLTTQQIIRVVNTANNELYSATLSFTRTDIANAIRNKKFAIPSAIMYSIFDDTVGSAAAYNIVKQALGTNAFEDLNTWSFHHKYLIVDQSDTASDPIILTGSHNWSTAAETRNDENTLIIHDNFIANQYYQEFIQRLKDNGKIPVFTNVTDNQPPILLGLIYPNPASEKIHIYSQASSEIVLLNMQGQIIYSNKNSLAHNVIDVSGLQKGMYFVMLTFDNKRVVEKIIVE